MHDTEGIIGAGSRCDFYPDWLRGNHARDKEDQFSNPVADTLPFHFTAWARNFISKDSISQLGHFYLPDGSDSISQLGHFYTTLKV